MINVVISQVDQIVRIAKAKLPKIMYIKSLVNALINSEVMIMVPQLTISVIILFQGKKEIPSFLTNNIQIVVFIKVTIDVLPVMPPTPNGLINNQSKKTLVNTESTVK